MKKYIHYIFAIALLCVSAIITSCDKDAHDPDIELLVKWISTSPRTCVNLNVTYNMSNKYFT